MNYIGLHGTNCVNIYNDENIYEKPLLKTFGFYIDDNLNLDIYINDEKYDSLAESITQDNIEQFSIKLIKFSKYMNIKKYHNIISICHTNINDLFSCLEDFHRYYLFDGFSENFISSYMLFNRIIVFPGKFFENINILKNKYIKFYISYSSHYVNLLYTFNLNNFNFIKDSNINIICSTNRWPYLLQNIYMEFCDTEFNVDNPNIFNKNYEQYNNTIFTISSSDSIDFKCILNVLRTTDSYLIIITPLKIIDSSTYYEIDFFSGKSSNCKECNKFTKFHKNFNNYYSRLCYLCKNHSTDLDNKLSHLINQKYIFSNNINQIEVSIDKNELLLKIKNILNIDNLTNFNLYTR